MSPETSIKFNRFLILLYKGLLLRKRHYIVTIFEIIIPILVASVPVMILGSANIPNDEGWIDDDIPKPFDPFKTSNYFSYNNEILFAYTPPNKHADLLMEEAIEQWKDKNRGQEGEIVTTLKVALNSSAELENFCVMQKRDNSSLRVIGTVFNNMPADDEPFPSNLDYVIRVEPPNWSGFSTTLKYRFSSYKEDLYARRSFFLSWQAAVEKAFIQMDGKAPDYDLLMQEFPFPGHKKESMSSSLTILLPLVITYAFLVFIINLMRRIIEEKSNGSKELMKMMGMTDFIYWTSNFLNYFIVGALVFLIICIIYKIPAGSSGAFLAHSNFLLVLIIFLLFMASLILFCFAITTFFNKAIFGVIIMIILYNVIFSLLTTFVFPFGQVEIHYYPLSIFVKFCICLTPIGAILSISEIISAYEKSGEGIQWYNLYSTETVPDFNVSTAMLSMLFSCFLYILITWYVDAVWPWQYGVPKPLYFPFTKSYWLGYQEYKTDESLLNSKNEAKNSDFFEEEPTGTSPGVVVSNLSKIFKIGLQTKVAVNNVSLNIYNGQITALLGHNGAGKTTTINILTGLYAPSGGTASINGWDIFTQTIKARQSLGVCPQHNVLFDTLTVEEHLKLYAALKGIGWRQLSQETDRVLEIIHLADKKTELSKNLSGGMKRKLSLGIALVAGSKVLFLDEPTSGMDVEARRSVWDALLNIRHNHTIILTTHYMEEADVLGDRIAIMADGEIQCCGSPLFLKKKFGTGYHLHIVKQGNFDINAVQNVLAKFVPAASLENEYEGEVTFNLMSNDHSNFGALFEEIESKKSLLGVNSCGVTVTTMEDVFLNVATVADMNIKSQAEFSLENAADETDMKDVYITTSEFGKSRKFYNQLFALFLKRMHYSKRHWSILLSQLIIPFIIMCMCLSIVKSISTQKSMSEPPLKLDISEVYGKTEGFYHLDSNSTSTLESMAGSFKKVFQEKNINLKSTNDPQNYVLKYARENIANYYRLLMVGGYIGMSEDKLNLTAWFNGYPYHTEPMSLLLMDTAILRTVSKSGYITLTNNPLPNPDTFFNDNNSDGQRALANVFLPLALAFLTASFVLVPIHERASKAKLLQMMTGISSVTYWLSMWTWDFIVSNIVSIFLIIPFASFTHSAFFGQHSEAIGAAICFMILYGWATIPFSYLFTLLFQKPNTGFSFVIGVCVIAGVALGSIFSALLKNPFVNMKAVRFFHWLFRLIPSYALSSGFGNLFSISYQNVFCETLDPDVLKYSCVPSIQPRNPIFKCCKDLCGNQCLKQVSPVTMDEDSCGRDLLFLFIDGIIYFVLLILIESATVKLLFYRVCDRYLRFLKFRKGAVIQFIDGNYTEDSDVLQEEERVRNNYEQVSHNDALVALNLTKVFKNIKAVDRLTFGIHEKECFGLLGVNGAGKTTTFRMITGDCYPTDGSAYIGNYSVTYDLKKFQSYLGYCPQFDPLIDRLSAREMITLFAKLRGLSGANMNRYINLLIKMTDLTQHADKPSMVYSGGNKRKLSIALALIGAPPLLLLDEPTAGVDPVSRRKIWKILSLARIHSGAAVILTTHSMEESEALCSRLAIMVNGRFRCLGSIQQLKSKFGQGYTLIIKMKKEEQSIPQSMNAVKAYIDTKLPGAHLKDDHQGMLQYHVVDPSITLSHLFKFMDAMKKNCNLEDYVISDTSLEQIFLTFARSQRVVAS